MNYMYQLYPANTSMNTLSD